MHCLSNLQLITIKIVVHFTKTQIKRPPQLIYLTLIH